MNCSIVWSSSNRTARGVPLPQVFVGLCCAERLHRCDGGVPYGIALAAAALVIYPHTQWIAAIGR